MKPSTLWKPSVLWARWRGWIIALIVLVLLIWSAQGTEFSVAKLSKGFPQINYFLWGLLPTSKHPWPLAFFGEIQKGLLETIRIAFAASLCGAVTALPFILIGARNLAASRLVYNLGRAILNLIRSVPDMVLVLLICVCIGFGPFAGFIALYIFSFGVVAKLLCDTTETIEPGPVEAITASGGTRFQRARYAVFPQVVPDFIAYSLYAFEINVRAAAILGLVGAGGIGSILKKSIGYMQYSQVGMIIGVTFVVVFLIDSLSSSLRRRLV
jgi:phosphonate transport system permease protein